MRLAVVTNILAPYRVPLLNRLAERDGVELRVFLAAEREPGRKWAWFDDIHFEYVIRRGLSWRGRSGFARHVDMGLPAALAEWKPDVVLAGGTMTIATLAERGARRAGCPFVWWMDATAESDAAMSPAYLMPFKRRLARRSAAFVASSTLAASYLDDLGAAPDRVRLSLLGIDAAPFHAAVRDWTPSRDGVLAEFSLETPVVLYCGQLEPYKGVDLLIDACGSIEPGKRPSLLLVGSGSMEERLRRKADDAGVRAAFVGFVQQEGLARFYAAADAFCLPSRCEPFGVVVAEAVAAHLPVVCSRHAGAYADLVVEGENGFVVEPTDRETFAKRLEAVTTDVALNAAMRVASSRMVDKLDVGRAADGIHDAAAVALSPRVSV